MNLFSTNELSNLAAISKEICVSIYMPTQRKGAETQQNPIRFKNLLRQAEEDLIIAGLQNQDARNLLKPAQDLDDYKFWQHQSDGLAVFISSNLLHYYRVPLQFDQLVVVTDRFHLKPLLQLLTGDGQFYILALSQNQVRLLQGTRFSVSEIALEDVPQSMAEALQYDDPEKSLQFHTGTPQGAGGGSRSAIFHGHGAGNEDADTDLLRYFQKVDRGIQEFLKQQHAPLVLAGVDYLLPIYQQANTYPNLLEAGISGNPEELKPEELHAQAWQIVQPHFEQDRQTTVARYQELAGTGQATNQVKDIVPAAYFQRVDSLFVAVGMQQWGLFNPTTNQVQLHETQEPGDEDLLDLAAIHTVLNGGTVHVTEPEHIPENVIAAAVFRY
jgi:hypothetical protein